jgi:hypothetical protein
MGSTITDPTLHDPSSFRCKRKDIHCSDFHSTDLGEVIKHLHSIHHITFIERPNNLGAPDSDGSLWCCGACKGECKGKSDWRRRKYSSDQAMWAHIKACHKKGWLGDIVETSDLVFV